MKDPVRNLLVYGDGRVEEVTFRLEGNYYMQAEKRPDGSLFHRRFEGDYAGDGHATEFDGNYTMVYVERPDNPNFDPIAETTLTVNGTPIPVDVPIRERGWDVRDVHRQCRAGGGHRVATFDDGCSLCGLTGYVIRQMRYLDERDDKEAKESAALRDKLVRITDENTQLLAENARMRRRLERSTPSGPTEP